jgi:hypothetical protein
MAIRKQTKRPSKKFTTDEIEELTELIISISNKNLNIKNLYGDNFYLKYGFKCPIGVKGRNSDNNLIFSKLNWKPKEPLLNGLEKTYKWIGNLIN